MMRNFSQGYKTYEENEELISLKNWESSNQKKICLSTQNFWWNCLSKMPNSFFYLHFHRQLLNLQFHEKYKKIGRNRGGRDLGNSLIFFLIPHEEIFFPSFLMRNQKPRKLTSLIWVFTQTINYQKFFF